MHIVHVEWLGFVWFGRSMESPMWDNCIFDMIIPKVYDSCRKERSCVNLGFFGVEFYLFQFFWYLNLLQKVFGQHCWMYKAKAILFSWYKTCNKIVDNFWPHVIKRFRLVFQIDSISSGKGTKSVWINEMENIRLLHMKMKLCLLFHSNLQR